MSVEYAPLIANEYIIVAQLVVVSYSVYFNAHHRLIQ